MCLPNNASMEEIHKAEVECLRRQLAEKEKEIQHLKAVIDLYEKEREEKEKSYERTFRKVK